MTEARITADVPISLVLVLDLLIRLLVARILHLQLFAGLVQHIIGLPFAENWRRDYNEVRPHSAIGNKPPVSLMNGSGIEEPP